MRWLILQSSWCLRWAKSVEIDLSERHIAAGAPRGREVSRLWAERTNLCSLHGQRKWLQFEPTHLACPDDPNAASLPILHKDDLLTPLNVA